MSLKQVTVTVQFVVDDSNTAGVKNFHDTVAGFLNQLKHDFNNDMQHSTGQIDVKDYEEKL